MCPLAIIAGIACNVVGLLLAERSFRAGRAAHGRLIQLARWPVLAVSIAVAAGLAGHGAARTLAWLAFGVIGVGLAARRLQWPASWCPARQSCWSCPGTSSPGGVSMTGTGSRPSLTAIWVSSSSCAAR